MTKQELQDAIKALYETEIEIDGKSNYSEIQRKENALVDAYCAQSAKKNTDNKWAINEAMVAVGY